MDDGPSGVVVYRVAAQGAAPVIAGEDRSFRFGVRLGALPGTLGRVSGLVAAGDNLLYCCSENLVLAIRLP